MNHREWTVMSRSVADTNALARRIGRLLEPGDVVLLAGDLGAGKTVFARGIAAGLEVPEPVVSPTFTLAREYRGRLRMLHVDVYRLDRVQEVRDLGLEDLAGDDAVTVVEWGDMVSGEFSPDRLEVGLGFVADEPDARRITVTLRGAAWSARAELVGAALEQAA